MNAELPPLEPLREVARRLDTAEIQWALGGSALMHALGLVDVVRDWDLTVDISQDAAHDALRDLTPTLHDNFGIHADHKVVCFDGTVEVICQFAFFRPHGGSGVIRIPTIVTGMWNGFPIGSPEAWAVAYALMIGEKPGRAEKADALFTWAREHGDAQRLAIMLAEPVPEEIAARLRELVRERGTARG